MEHFEAGNHNIVSQNIQISAYTSIPSDIQQQPKTRCPHCCYHRSQTTYPCATLAHHSPSCSCNGTVCTRTCFSSLQSQFSPPPPTACGCSTPVVVRQHHHPSSSQILPQDQNGCPCCRRLQSAAALVDHHHQISRIHLTTDNLTYPSPHYATAYASLPGLHHSWEPTAGYPETEYNIHMSVLNGSSAPEYHSHVHHHQHQHINHASDNDCTDRQTYRDQSWQSYTSRHYRRHTSRVASHPYPSIIHYPVGYHYPALPRNLIQTSYIFPPRHLIPASFEVIGELETEPLTDEDWQEIDARNAEPKGLTKHEIQKLPSYFVTKNTMKDFTDNERCVICMCEFEVENSIRILPCAHEFHCECVDKWLETNLTCPICRSTVEVT